MRYFYYLGSCVKQHIHDKDCQTKIGKSNNVFGRLNKKLSYRRETARQLRMST